MTGLDPSASHSLLLARLPAADPVVAAFGALLFDDVAEAPYAHVTTLGPFLAPEELTPAVVDRIADLAAAHLPFNVRFGDLDQFPDGMVWLAPDDPAPFRALTLAMWRAFPYYPPYGGQFDEVIPHLSLGRLPDHRTLDDAVRTISPLLPVTEAVDALQLIWWSPPDRIDVLHEWTAAGA